MAVTSLFFFLFFLLILISGSGAELLVKEVGTSVQMHIQEANFSTSTFDELYWKFNDKTKIIIFIQGDVVKLDELKDRMEFSKETCMLTLNNLKKTDGGQYEAIASSGKDRSVAKYTLSVVDAVKTPELTCQPDKNTCNIAVCKGQHSTISSSCTKENCEKKKETSGDITLSIFMDDSTIICKQSNTVNWKSAELAMEKGEKNAASDPYPRLPWPVLSAVLIVTQILNII